MPHTSRKRPPQGPQKRHQVTDDSGWTHITRGTIKQPRRQPPTSNAPIEKSSLRPAEIPPGLTIQKVRQNFNHHLKIWKASTCFLELRKVIERQVFASHAVKIDRCVCLGLGSFTGGRTVEASMYELAALVSIFEILCLFPFSPSSSSTSLLSLSYFSWLKPIPSNKVYYTRGLYARPHLQRPRYCFL